MSKVNRRVKQVSDSIQKSLAAFFCSSGREPWFPQLTITEVALTSDLKSATIYFTVFDQSKLDEIKAYFQLRSGFLRNELASHANLRYTPQLRFIYDASLEQRERISRLIDSLPDTDNA